MIYASLLNTSPRVATPTFSPVPGEYEGTQNVTITSATSGADLYYTTDGSTPDQTDTLYTVPVVVSSTETIKVKGFKVGYLDSFVATGTFTIEVEPPLTLTRSSTGLLLSENFDSIADWTNEGGFSVVADPAMMASAPNPYYLLLPNGTTEIDGVREPQILDRGTDWLVLYDAGSLTVNYDQRLGKTTNKGLSVTRLGGFGFERADGGADWLSTATGGIEKFGDWYYRHAVTTNTVFGAPYDRLTAPPYSWDIWKTQTPETLAWTPVRTIGAPAPLIEIIPGFSYYDGSTYHHFAQGQEGGDHYKVWRFTAATPDGAFALSSSTPVLDITATYSDANIENPHGGSNGVLGKFLIFCNTFPHGGNYANGTVLFVGDSVTTMDTAAVHWIQFCTDIVGDVPRAVGVLTPMMQPDGVMVVDPDSGDIPALFDSGERARWAPQPHLGRDIRSVVLRASTHRLRFSDSSSTRLRLSRALAHDDCVIEMWVRFANTTTSTNIAVDFRDDGTGNGYVLVLANGNRMLLYSRTAGVYTNIPELGAPVIVPTNTRWQRLRLVMSGSSICAWLDNELQLAAVNADYASGTHIALSGFDATVDVRDFSMWKNDAVTVTGVTPGQTVVLRGVGDLPVVVTTADASGIAVLRSPSWPQKKVQVGSQFLSIGSDLQGGDELVVDAASPATVPSVLWTPDQDGESVIYDFNASNAVLSGSIVTSVPDPVSGVTVTPPTSGQRPTISATGFNGVLPSIVFDGTDDCLRNPAWDILNGATECTVLIVSKNATPTESQMTFCAGTASAVLAHQVFQNDIYAYCNGVSTIADINDTGTTWRAHAVVYEGGRQNNARMRIFNASRQLVTSSDANAFAGTFATALPSEAGLAIGAYLSDAAFWHGEIRRIVFINQALDYWEVNWRLASLLAEGT